MRIVVSLCVLWFAEYVGTTAELPAPASHEVDFKRDVQPLLADRCFSCHGVEKQKGGLRLDHKASALVGGDSGKVIVPGRSADSLLIQNVAGIDPDNLMPPEGKGERLTKEQIGLLRAWIDAGAQWPDELAAPAEKSKHWAFQPVVRPPLPDVARKDWSQNPIDRFILARLESEQIAPSPDADRATLIRRLSLDLTGLPPRPERVRAFINDTNPRAYEELVDEFLSSPHFGERWTRHWLDLARYADSDGYEKDGVRPYAFLYRDWVIDAINRDVPFDQFTIEQLAGDLLPNSTLEQKKATGFHRQTLTNKEGGVDQEEFRCKATVDRVNTTATVWLGLTVGCAECHTHKYDPITQREYYQFYAFFNNANEKDVEAPRPVELVAYQRAKAQWNREHERLNAQLKKHLSGEFGPLQAEWERERHQRNPSWFVLKPASAIALNGSVLKIDDEGVVSASGPSPARDTYTIEVDDGLTNVTGFRLEVLDDPDPTKGAGRSTNGNFVISEFTVRIVNPKGESTSITLTNATADAAQQEHPPANAIDGKPSTGWSVPPQREHDHVAAFEALRPVDIDGKLVVTVAQQYGAEHTLSRFRLSATTSPPPFALMPREIAAILVLQLKDRTSEQHARLLKFYREEIDPETVSYKRRIAAHARREPKFPETKAAVLEARQRETHVHVRGDFLRPGDEVEPGTLSILHPLRKRRTTADRLDLAHWLVEAENPLTARVAVNHAWKHLFGRGLVSTVDDFGTRGEKPSHPELLDWLASEFQRSHWSRKALLRLIATSATYRQASHSRPDLAGRDPNNTLLARQNRLRLEGEIIRDAHLAVSGLLNAEVGGPSVRPPLPADITSIAYANQIKWKNSEGADKYRRGLYTFIQRTVPYPMLMTFDGPDSNVSCTRRERSNTPLQALTLLNDPVFFECAQALGRDAAALAESDTKEKVRHLFTRCLSRTPTQAELDRLAHFHEVQTRLLRSSPLSARALTGMQEVPADDFEAATFVALARTLMNLDEFVTRE